MGWPRTKKKGECDGAFSTTAMSLPSNLISLQHKHTHTHTENRKEGKNEKHLIWAACACIALHQVIAVPGRVLDVTLVFWFYRGEEVRTLQHPDFNIIQRAQLCVQPETQATRIGECCWSDGMCSALGLKGQILLLFHCQQMSHQLMRVSSFSKSTTDNKVRGVHTHCFSGFTVDRCKHILLSIAFRSFTFRFVLQR